MNFARVGRFVVKCRRLMSKEGCRRCQRVLPQGLFLKGEPQLTEMARAGATVSELKTAMRERGWYCRTCVNKMKSTTTTTTSLRDRFSTQEEYFEWLMVNRPNLSARARKDKEKSPGPGPGDGLCTIN